jgi:hypothetical protein
MNGIDLTKLSREAKERLLSELETEKQAERERIREDRETFKQLKDEAIREVFGRLRELSGQILTAKRTVFTRFDTIRGMKDDLFKTRSDRNTDTYTTEDGRISMKLGHRVYEGWDDTVEVGIQKVRNYLKTLARDENSANLVETVMSLLSRDRKGNLKATKVLELEKLAKKSGDSDFMDGLTIIKEAYRPVPSCQFIEVKYKDEKGREQALPLSISAFD